MTEQIVTVEADRALKARHRAMWALGDYPAMAAEIIPNLGAILVKACGVGHGDRCLTSRLGRAMRPFLRRWPGPAWWLAT